MEVVEGTAREEAVPSVVKHAVVHMAGLLVAALDGLVGMRAVCMVTGLKGDERVMEALTLASVWVAQER